MQISTVGNQASVAIYTKDNLEEAKAYEKAMTTYSTKEVAAAPAEKDSADTKPGVITDSVNISDEARVLAQSSAVARIENIDEDDDSAGFGGMSGKGQPENSDQRTLGSDEENSGTVQYGSGAVGSSEGSGSESTVQKLRKQIAEVQKQIQEVQAEVQGASQEVNKSSDDQSTEAVAAQSEMEAAQLELNALNAKLLTLQKALMDAMKEEG